MTQDATSKQLTTINLIVAMAVTAGISVAGAMAWMYGSFATQRQHDQLRERLAGDEAAVAVLRDTVAATQSQANSNANILARIEKGQEKVETKIDTLTYRVLQATGAQPPPPGPSATRTPSANQHGRPSPARGMPCEKCP